MQGLCVQSLLNLTDLWVILMALVNFNSGGTGEYLVYFDSDLNQIFLYHLLFL